MLLTWLSRRAVGSLRPSSSPPQRTASSRSRSPLGLRPAARTPTPAWALEGLPPSPTRSWRKKTGPLEVSFIAAAVSSHNGANTTSTSTATTTSIRRLTACCHVGISSGLSSISGTPWIWVVRTWPVTMS